MNSDTNLCYISEKYPSTIFAIEKKKESEEDVRPSLTPLMFDINGDCISEILVTGNDGDNQLYIIDPISGKTIKKIVTYFNLSSASPYAIADVNNDGQIEIVMAIAWYQTMPANIRGKLICFDLNGNLKWVSDQRFDNGNLYTLSGAPAFADFNQDGIPEVYIHNVIYNAQNGIKIADGGINGIGAGGELPPVPSISLSVAAQLDDNIADLELAAGYTVYKVSITNPNGMIGNSMTPHNMRVDNEFIDGFTTVADIDLDGILDIVVASNDNNNAKLFVYSMKNGFPVLLAKSTISSGTDNYIGPPIISDVNGSGIMSIIVNTPNQLHSFKYNGSITLAKEWNLVVQDVSGYSGLTIFDLNNDGKKEIIYRDEGYLRIINVDLNVPKELARISCPAPSREENPIVGGIDSSGQAKICVICQNKDDTGGKLYIFGPPDSLPAWAPARGIWNQYNYHVLNINDDLTVPRVQKNNATYKNGRYNNFYEQQSLLEDGNYLKKAASLTGKIKCINYDPFYDEYTVIFDIYNLTNASFSADSSLPVAFYNGDPAASGKLIDIYYTLKKMQSGDSLLNLEFRFKAINLTDLFMVVNTKRDSNGVFNPIDFAIGECDYTDNISRTLELPKIEKLSAAICEGNGYQFYDTLLYDAGIYYHKINSATGCDSIWYLLEVTTKDSIHINQAVTTCDTYIWNGQTYTQSGTFVHDTINRFGCDSITTIDLVINSSNAINIQQTACESFSWNGNTYDKSGSYLFQTSNRFGCDSITTLELVINKSNDLVINHTACNSYVWNAKTYVQSGIYKFDTINQFGCDSSVTLDLTINSIINVTNLDVACDSLTWNGNTYTQSGTYQYKTINQQGCDSITTLQLTINSSNNSITTLTTCDNYTWNGITYGQSGSYQFKTQNAVGCDSTAFLQLTVNKSSNSITTLNICDSITWNGVSYDQSGSYQFQTLNSIGCDSIATLNLTINKSDYLVSNQSACDSFTWNGNTYNKSGNYLYQTLNNLGCDSVINLNLTINKSSKADLALSVCDSLNFLGNTLNTSGTYTFLIPNSQGCDSTINLSLNIQSTFYNQIVSSCDSFTWDQNGRSYDQSGQYIQKYNNRFGCDSVYLLDLRIQNSFELFEQAQSCRDYYWPVSKTILKQSGDYVHPLKTTAGCDSVYKLQLIIQHDFEKRDTVITDTAYTWPINQQSYPVSGTYRESFQTNAGCDSVHYLVLFIKKKTGIYYPNVIHPGGPNGWFTIFDNGITIEQINTLSIYDRWGDLIWQKQGFAANVPSLGWDATVKGKAVLPGVYVWHAQLALQDGSLVTEKGDVTVLR